MFLPLRDENPTSRFPFLTILIIALNTAIFLYQVFSPQGLVYHVQKMGDAVLALYDGNPVGGTYMTLCYAGSKGKPVTNLWRAWRKYGSTSPRLLEMPLPQGAS